MIGMKLNKAKSMFFDRRPIISAKDRATRRVLSRFGAYVRTRARSSIRKRKRASAPGQPPSSHTGLLKKIYFGYDPGPQSVVIGPIKLNAKSSGVAPELLEEGGTTRKDYGKDKGKMIRIQPRPFMGPAFEAEKPQLPKLWQNSIKR